MALYLGGQKLLKSVNKEYCSGLVLFQRGIMLKNAATRSSKTASLNSSKPFFRKNGEGGFFPKSDKTTGSTSSSSLARPRFAVNRKSRVPTGRSLKQESAAIQRTPEDQSEQQESNIYRERNFNKLSDAQRRNITQFCNRAKQILERWGTLRPAHQSSEFTGDYNSYVREMRAISSELQSQMREFKRELQNLPTHTTREVTGPLGPSHIHRLAFHQNEQLREEVFRQLNVGHFPQYLKELATLHAYEVNLVSYTELFKEFSDFEISSRPHVYRLQTLAGLDLGAGEVLTGGVSGRGYKILYRNDLGMSWNVNVYGGNVRGGGGLSVSPVEVNVDSSLGSDDINAGTAEEYRYFPPSYFNNNLMTMIGLSAAVGGGYNVSAISLGDVEFDTSGFIVRAGTADVGEAGGEIGLGYFHGTGANDFSGLPEAQEVEQAAIPNDWVRVLAAVVFFRSEEAELDSDDRSTIGQVVEAILRHDQHYPGDIFQIKVHGTATERWATPARSAQAAGVDVSDIEGEDRRSRIAERLNRRLALRRAQIAYDEFSNQIGTQRASLTPGVLDFSRWEVSRQILRVSPENSDLTDDEPINRRVQISLYYKTSPDGNVRLGG